MVNCTVCTCAIIFLPVQCAPVQLYFCLYSVHLCNYIFACTVCTCAIIFLPVQCAPVQLYFCLYSVHLCNYIFAVADKCVDPETGVAVQHALVLSAMKEIHYSVKPSQSAKKQALEVIPKLEAVSALSCT